MLHFRSISKGFPGVKALSDVSFEVAKGEVLAVIGENGAGKSTLMKILGGVYQPDEGEILLDDARITVRDPGDALSRGIRVIYQELSVLENLDIASNIFLGRERLHGLGLLNTGEMIRLTEGILKRMGLNLNPRTLVSSLSLAERQLVEIARALSTDVRILVLDEPTSSLTMDETNRLMNLIRELKSTGVTSLFITHRLDEVIQVADRVVVLKDGRLAGELPKDQISHDNMVRLMVGRDLNRDYVRSGATLGAPRLTLKGVTTTRYPNCTVDLELKAGEIVGMAGLVGAGRSELARAVFGVDPMLTGEVLVDGQPIHLTSSCAAIDSGIYLVPEDRRGAGLVVDMSVRENISLPSLPQYSSAGLINGAKEKEVAQMRTAEFRVKTASIETPVKNLSGGNQQKVVLARWIPRSPKVMIFDEPTRGIDVGSKSEIYEQMRALAREGVAIWMISSDMEEVFSVSDRIVVLSEGKVAGSLNRDEATEEAVMKLAVGEAK